MVIDMWDHPIMDRPDLLSADRIHFAASGQAVLAAEVVKALARRARGASMTETVAAGTVARTSSRAWWGTAAALVAAAWSANQFAPLIVMYQADLGLSGSELDAMYAVYVIGLVPALLVGGRLSDAIGRRRVVLPAMVLCLVGTLALMAGGAEPGWLYPGRLVTGLGCGLAYVAATAWLKELSAAAGTRAPARNARRCR